MIFFFFVSERAHFMFPVLFFFLLWTPIDVWVFVVISSVDRINRCTVFWTFLWTLEFLPDKNVFSFFLVTVLATMKLPNKHPIHTIKHNDSTTGININNTLYTATAHIKTSRYDTITMATVRQDVFNGVVVAFVSFILNDNVRSTK